jgi:hypothetical protein
MVGFRFGEFIITKKMGFKIHKAFLEKLRKKRPGGGIVKGKKNERGEGKGIKKKSYIKKMKGKKRRRK